MGGHLLLEALALRLELLEPGLCLLEPLRKPGLDLLLVGLLLPALGLAVLVGGHSGARLELPVLGLQIRELLLLYRQPRRDRPQLVGVIVEGDLILKRALELGDESLLLADPRLGRLELGVAGYLGARVLGVPRGILSLPGCDRLGSLGSDLLQLAVLRLDLVLVEADPVEQRAAVGIFLRELSIELGHASAELLPLLLELRTRGR